MIKDLNKGVLEVLIGQEVLLKDEDGEFIAFFGENGLSFRRYVNCRGEKVCETLQIVDNTIRANRKKREVVWRREPPSYESGYREFVVPY